MLVREQFVFIHTYIVTQTKKLLNRGISIDKQLVCMLRDKTVSVRAIILLLHHALVALNIHRHTRFTAFSAPWRLSPLMLRHYSPLLIHVVLAFERVFTLVERDRFHWLHFRFHMRSIVLFPKKVEQCRPKPYRVNR